MTTSTTDRDLSSQAVDSAIDSGKAVSDKIKTEAEELGSKAQGLAAQAASEHAEAARVQVSRQGDAVQDAVNDVAATVGEYSDTLGQYAGEFADQVSRLNDRIKSSSVDDLAGDVRRLARDNPAMFMLGAVSIGVIASRFFRASDRSVPTDKRHYGRDDTHGGIYPSQRSDSNLGARYE